VGNSTEYHILPTTHSHVTILIVVSPSVQSFIEAFPCCLQ